MLRLSLSLRHSNHHPPPDCYRDTNHHSTPYSFLPQPIFRIILAQPFVGASVYSLAWTLATCADNLITNKISTIQSLIPYRLAQVYKALAIAVDTCAKFMLFSSPNTKNIYRFNPLFISPTSPSSALSWLNSQNIIPASFLRRTNFVFSVIDFLSSKVAYNFLEGLYR